MNYPRTPKQSTRRHADTTPKSTRGPARCTPRSINSPRIRQQGVRGQRQVDYADLALGAEKSFGAQQAEIMREVGTNVEGGIIANSGHWIMEEQPDATVKAVRDFLEKK
jgi:pimeloyl-ACP methyl ester carboxylesterase